MKISVLNYRSNLDGIRGLAIIAVFLYHFDKSKFSLGFLGVDVFFVLSGYLITRIVSYQINKGIFQYKVFLLKRARRLIPALLFLYLLCLILSWLLLPSYAMKDFSQSLIASNFFVSNFLFLHEVDYFDTSATLKPLLHTWSLAVEFQFYLIWPSILFCVSRIALFSRHKFFLISLFGSLSFVVAQSLLSEYPMEVFYLLPFRLWEFTLGALAALIELTDSKSGVFTKRIFATREILWTSLFLYISLLFYAIFFLPRLETIRVFLALLTFFVIQNYKTTSKLDYFLRNSYLISLGKLSYGVYLFHYPVIIFFDRIPITSNTVLRFSLICLLTLAISIFSKAVIEDSFKSTTLVSDSLFLLTTGTLILLLSIISILGHNANGFQASKTYIPTKPVPLLFNANVTLFGDSHLGEIFDTLRKSNLGTSQDLTRGGCIPLLGINQWSSYSGRGECSEWTKASYDYIKNHDSPKLILVSSMTYVYLTGIPFKGQQRNRVEKLELRWKDTDFDDRWEIYKRGLQESFQELSELEGVDVVFALDYPELGIENGCLDYSKQLRIGSLMLNDFVLNVPPNECRVSRADFESRSRQVMDLVNEVRLNFPNIKIYDPSIAFCDNHFCRGYTANNGYLYSDADHLSDNGAIFYLTNFAKFLENNGLGKYLYSK